MPLKTKARELKSLKLKNSVYVKNSLWLISERMLRLILSFIVWGKLAKDLSLQDFGHYSQYQNIAMTMLPLITFGSNQYIKKRLIESSNDSCFLTSAIFTRFIISVMVFLGLSLMDVFVIQRDYQLLGSFIYFTLILRSFDVIELFFDSNLASKNSSRIKSLANVATSCLYGFAIWYQLGLLTLGAIFLLEYLFTSSFYLKTLLSRGLFNRQGLYFNFSLIKGSLLYFCAEIFTTLQNRLSFFIAELSLGISSVALISVAFRISDLGLIIPSTVSITFLSLIMNSSEDKVAVIKNLKFLNLFWLIILVGFSLFGEKLISLFFGIKYLELVFPIKILLVSNLFVYWGFILEALEVKHNRLRKRVLRTLLGFAINLALCLILIPRYGVNGAAIAYLASVAVNFHFSQYVFKETREYAILQLKSLILLKKHS